MTASQEQGRVLQKRRTRRALLAAAVALSKAGQAPTVPEVAEAAEVSRRTAYRYFPSQEQLLTELNLEQTRSDIEPSLPQATGNRDPVSALTQAIEAIQSSAFQNEALLRALIRLSMEQRLGGQRKRPGARQPVRGIRRVEWIEAALAPARKRLTKRRFERLVSAIAMCVGPEAIIVLRDIRALSKEEVIETCKWAAKALLLASLEESGRK